MSALAWTLVGVGGGLVVVIAVFLVYAGHLAVKIDGVECPKDWKRKGG